jgi:hypothetical protein
VYAVEAEEFFRELVATYLYHINTGEMERPDQLAEEEVIRSRTGC